MSRDSLILRRAPALLLAGLCALQAGCAAPKGGAAKSGAAPAAAAAAAAPAPTYRPVSDVHLPPGTRVDVGKDRSLILGGPDRWFGRLVLVMDRPPEEVYQTLLARMPDYGWALLQSNQGVQSSQGGLYNLLFSRDDRVGAIDIVRSGKGSVATMLVSPRPAAPAPGAPPAARTAAAGWPVADVPVLPGARVDMDKDRTLILGAPDAWYGRLVFSVDRAAELSYQTFVDQMPGLGWTLIQTSQGMQSTQASQAKAATLTYMKGERAALVEVAGGGKSSQIIVLVSPRPAGGAAVAPAATQAPASPATPAATAAPAAGQK